MGEVVNGTVVKLFRYQGVGFALIEMEGKDESMDVMELAGLYRRAAAIKSRSGDFGELKLNNGQHPEEPDLHIVLVRPSARNLSFAQLERLLAYLMPARHPYKVECHQDVHSSELRMGLLILSLVMRREARGS